MNELRALALRTVMGAFPGTDVPDWLRRRLDEGLGSVCLFGSNIDAPEQLATLTAQLHEYGDGVITATDEEGGDVTRLHMRAGSPAPGNAALGAVDDLDLTADVARSIGAQLRAAGIDLDLGPVADVNSNPANPVIGVRSFGADPVLAGHHTAAYVRGLQDAGTGACVKHWPGHGDTAVDSHLGLPTVDAPLSTLRTRELVPFQAAVAAGTVAVMTSHVVLPALDRELPATLSPAVTALLRDELGFSGLLVSDALDMKGASAGRGEPAAAVLSLRAGVDLLCLGADKDAALIDAIVDAVVAAVRSGDLPYERLLSAATAVRAADAALAALRAGACADPGDGPAVRASAAALRVFGDLPSLVGATVLRFEAGTNVAVGSVPWGLPADGRVLAGRRQRDVGPDDDVRACLTDGVPVVALVRELHRHAWVADAVGRLLAARPDAVVVEMGWPGPEPLPGSAWVLTHGASRSVGAALDALLAGGTA